MPVKIICHTDCIFSKEGICTKEDDVLMLEADDGIIVCDDYVPSSWKQE